MLKYNHINKEWMVSGTARRIYRVVVLTLASAPVLHVGAQISPESDPDVTITTIGGPKTATFAIGDGTAWFQGNHLYKVDPRNNQLTSVPIEQLKTVGYAEGGFAVGGGSVWRFGKAHDVEGVHRVDPGTGKCIATIALKPRKGMNSLTYGEGSLWVLNRHDGNLVRIDPATNQVSVTIELGKGFWLDLKISDGAVWAMGEESGIVKRVDPQSNKVVDEFTVGSPQKNGIFTIPFVGGSYYFSFGDRMLWVVDSKDTSSGYKCVLSRIDPKTHERIAQIEIDDSNGTPVFWHGYVWLATARDNAAGHVITKINPKTNRVVGQVVLPTWSGGFVRRGSLAPPSLLADENSLWDFTPRYENAPIIVRRIQAKPTEVGHDQE
jgi:virginiamycin B lyase